MLPMSDTQKLLSKSSNQDYRSLYFRDEGSPDDGAVVDIKIKDCSIEDMKELLFDFAMSKYPIFNTK